jgi:tetratricopeptide (TPR) repeat protein
MKFLVVLFFIVAFCAALYILIIHIKKINWKALGTVAILGVILTAVLVVIVYKTSKMPDTWCDHFQNTTSYPPTELKTATDYFLQGNYDYDTGNCKGAVTDYAKSIELNSKYPQAYNNRAFTYMRMGDYKDALTDLDKALALNPNYINALMNRGDIHNYYYEIDRKAAVADYEKVIALGGTRGTSVCGHLFLAEHNGWNLGTVFALPSAYFQCM